MTRGPGAARLLLVSDWQERLAEAMDARGLSGGDLARRTGFTAQYINSLRKKERGARLPLETAQRIAQALGVTVEWLVRGDGAKETQRLSDVYPVYSPEAQPEPYPSRAEVLALLTGTVEPEVLAALRAATLPTERDPGRDFWITYAKDLLRVFRSIQADPDFHAAPAKKSVR